MQATSQNFEAAPGIEPGWRDLQSFRAAHTCRYRHRHNDTKRASTWVFGSRMSIAVCARESASYRPSVSNALAGCVSLLDAAMPRAALRFTHHAKRRDTGVRPNHHRVGLAVRRAGRIHDE